MPLISSQNLKEIASALFQAWDTPPDEADWVAELLVASNLAGHESHGVLRLPDYLKSIEEGEYSPGAPVEVVKEAAAMAILDGNWNFGQVVAREVADLAIEKAKAGAVAVVTAHNVGHVGRLADYCAMAANANCIGIMSTNGHGADQDVAPYGGTDRRLPTNPIGFGFPTGKGFNFILDMTTSVVATGKLRFAQNRGQSIPEGWILDADGNHTTDPKDFFGPPIGCSLPLGGYKGFGMGLVLDVLSGALNEAGCTRGEPCRIGNAIYFQAINIGAFTTMEEFVFQVDRLIDFVKASPLAEGFDEIRIPGEASARRATERKNEGIPIDDVTWQSIQEAAGKRGVTHPILASS